MIRYSEMAYDFDAALDAIEQVTPATVAADSTALPRTAPEYSEFDAAEYALRYARLRTLMRREGIDAVITSQEENHRYFSGYLTVLWISKFRPFLSILTAGDAPCGLVVPGQERGNAEITSWIDDVCAFPPQEPPIGYLVEELRKRDLTHGRIGIELGFGQRLGMNQEQFAELVKALPEVEFVDATPLFQTVRMLKSEAEIARLEQACAISGAAVEAGFRAAKAGMTERELTTVIGTALFAAGADVSSKPSFFGVLAGERWRLANAVASDYRFQEGDLILLDGGACYRGYSCDFIRQACIGRATDEQRAWFEAAIVSNDAAIAAIAPGVPAHEVYQAGLDSLADQGYGEYNRMNIIGHGVGADVHEIPWIGQRDLVYTSNVRLREGMVLSIEPGMSPPHELDLRGHFIVEDMVAVTADGTRNLTPTPAKQLWETGAVPAGV